MEIVCIHISTEFFLKCIVYCCHVYHKLIAPDCEMEGIRLDGTDFSFLLLSIWKKRICLDAFFFPVFLHASLCRELKCMLNLVIFVLVILVMFELLWLLISVICNEKTDWLVCLKGFLISSVPLEFISSDIKKKKNEPLANT